MIAVPLAIACLLGSVALLALTFAAGFIGSKLVSDGEFSWGRYGAWLVGALLGGVLLVASRTSSVFLVVAAALLLWVWIRAAVDAQATTLRQKLGFLQLYAALLLIEGAAMARTDTLSGTRASARFAYVIQDYVAELVLPILNLAAGKRMGSLADGPSAFVSSLAVSIAGHWLLEVALATFALAAFVYAFFAEQATPKIGLSSLPVPTLITLAFAALFGISRLGPTGPAAFAAYAVIVLTPYFVAEGLWVVRRLASRLRTRAAWTILLAVLSLLAPSLAGGLAVLGWAFYLVRLRAFAPILGDGERSRSRPRLSALLVISGVASLVLLVLGIAEGAWLHAVSPALGVGPEVCSAVTFTPSANGVVVTAPTAHFTIDADETPLKAASFDDVERACARAGGRVCTSDEWALACVCTYPSESEGGTKLETNDRLSYRIESNRRDPSGGTLTEVHRLLSGGGEVVGPRIPGATLIAGPSDAVDDPWSVDCRARGLATNPVLESAGTLLAARCCR